MKPYLRLSSILFCTLVNFSFAEIRTGKMVFVSPWSGSEKIDFSVLVNEESYTIGMSGQPVKGSFPEAEITDLTYMGIGSYPRLTSPYSLLQLNSQARRNLSREEIISQKWDTANSKVISEINLRLDSAVYKISTSEGNSAYLFRNGTIIGGYDRYSCTWVYQTASGSTRLAQSKGNKFHYRKEASPLFSLKGGRLEKNTSHRFSWTYPAL